MIDIGRGWLDLAVLHEGGDLHGDVRELGGVLHVFDPCGVGGAAIDGDLGDVLDDDGQLGQAGRQVEEAVGIGAGKDGVHNQASGGQVGDVVEEGALMNVFPRLAPEANTSEERVGGKVLELGDEIGIAQAMSLGLDTEVDLFSQADDVQSVIVVDGGLQYGEDAAHNSAHLDWSPMQFGGIRARFRHRVYLLPPRMGRDAFPR
ncbi:MAG: hypothetical protein VX911_10160 [Candidatus Latescibacterota bacterium]|nr:hypothetical protein [Candidatus Latescibacterota bacterium]